MARAARLVVWGLLVVTLTGCLANESPTGLSEASQPPEISGRLRTGWILGRNQLPIQVHFQVENGLAVYQGDMILGREDQIAKTREELLSSLGISPTQSSKELFGIVTNSAACNSSGGFCVNRRWHIGEVPYDFGAGHFTPDQRQTILDGMALVRNGAAGVSFRPRAWYDEYWVRFVESTGCQSFIGQQNGGAQTVKLTTDFCRPGQPAEQKGVVAHELLHALGMFHEQSRCDRDSFVSINWNNIDPGGPLAPNWQNFAKECDGADDYLEYDESSIMHYATWAFAVDQSQPTIISLRGRDADMGQRLSLSSFDRRTLNLVYRPYAPSGVLVTNEGGTPRVSWDPSPGAVNYSVNLVQVYEEYDDYSGTSIIQDANINSVGATTTPSILDTQRSYTGNDRCVLWSHTYGSASYAYYYEISASYLDGVTSMPVRWPAPVGIC